MTQKYLPNKHARPPNTRTQMYIGRVAVLLFVSHVEYAPRRVPY